MSISILAAKRDLVIRILLTPLLLFLTHAELFGNVSRADEGRIENARWSLVGNVVVIRYDLVADAGKNYEVKVILRRQSDENFQVSPRTVAGAVGEGKFVGTGREIRWDYKKDVPVLFGDDYFFEFMVYPQEGGSNALLYVGGLLVAGGVVAYLIGKKKEEAGLPSPPGERPPEL